MGYSGILSPIKKMLGLIKPGTTELTRKQTRSDLVAMHQRAMSETDEERCFRLGVAPTEKLNNTPPGIFTISIAHVEAARPEKDASFDFNVCGDSCKVKYFSDYLSILPIINPDNYHYDPRRWVDVFYKDARHGYVWNEGYWTHSTAEIDNDLLDIIELGVCKGLELLLPCIAPGSIITTHRESDGKSYIISGVHDKINIVAKFKQRGRVVDFLIAEQNGKYNTKNYLFTAPVRVCPSKDAIISWITNEFNFLKPLKGALPCHNDNEASCNERGDARA